MLIPVNKLSAEALSGMIEEFVSREGTDYGERVVSFDKKIMSVKRQIDSGSVVIVFDDDTQSCNLMLLEDWQALAGEIKSTRG